MQDLSDRLENEILAQCIRTAPELGFLFDGRSEVLHQKMDRLLRRRYEDDTGDDYLKISFVLGGSCTPAT